MAPRSARPLALLLIASLAVSASLTVLAPVSEASGGKVLAVIGETHGTSTVTRELVSQAAAKGATGCICPGDFIFGDWSATPSSYRSMMQPFMGTMLPAQGNHDWPWSDWQSMFPGGKPYYTQLVDGVRVISLNPEQGSLSSGSTQRVWLESTLKAEPAGALKVVFLHRPWWLGEGAHHSTSDFEAKAQTRATTMDALMRDHGVDLVVAAHEKSYQHSLRDGVHYLVAGGAGPAWDKYPLGYPLDGAVKRLSTPVASVLRIGGTSMTLESFDNKGNFVESFTMGGSSSTTSPAPSTGTFSAKFTPSGGNEWWVQTKVDATSSLAKVEARVNGGAWKALELKSWGAWAASFHAPSGSMVEFRATSTSGATATSGGYAWPSATPVSSGGSTPTSGTFTAKFAPSGGNEWWVQTRVDASAGLARVDARVNGGAWQPLALKSWGAWAASFHAPSGSTVEFRATSTSGATATSGGYLWPSGASTGSAPAPSASTFSATFAPHDGNSWWVQAKVDSASSLSKVEARVNGGAWKSLELKSWGSWATSMSAPTGSKVEFRATSTSGATATSGAYTWPVK